jgi:hypothetical protein
MIMKSIWKWIIGIIVVLAVLVLLAAPFALRLAYGYDHGTGRSFDGPGPMTYHRDLGNWDRHSMGGRGSPPFFGGFFLLGGLVKLAVFGGLLYGAYWLGRRNARVALDPASPADPKPASVEPEPALKRRGKSAKNG